MPELKPKTQPAPAPHPNRGALLLEPPEHVRAARHVLEVVERHHHDGDLAEGDVLAVARLEHFERLAARGKVLPSREDFRHTVLVHLEPTLREQPDYHELHDAPRIGMQYTMAGPRDDERHYPVSQDVHCGGGEALYHCRTL